MAEFNMKIDKDEMTAAASFIKTLAYAIGGLLIVIALLFKGQILKAIEIYAHSDKQQTIEQPKSK